MNYRAATIVTDSLLAAECFSELPNITGWAFAGLAAPAQRLAAVLYQMYTSSQVVERQKAESRRQEWQVRNGEWVPRIGMPITGLVASV